MKLQTPDTPPEHLSTSDDVSTGPGPRKAHRFRRIFLWVMSALVAAFLGLLALGLLLGEPPGENAHEARGGEPELAAVPGYTYEEGASQDAQALATRVNVVNSLALASYPELARGPYVSWSTHAVFGSRHDQVGVLVLATLNPEYLVANRRSSPEGLAVGLAQMMASSETTTYTTIAGRQVSVVTDVNSAPYFAWEHDNVAAMFVPVGKRQRSGQGPRLRRRLPE